MDRLVTTGIVAVFCLTLTTSLVAAGLKCYVCTDVEPRSSSTIISTAMKALQNNNRYCNTSVDDSTPGVKVEYCPEPHFGKEARCAKTRGVGGVSFVGIDFSVEFYSRECVEEDIGSPEGCKQSNHEDQSLLANVIGVIGLDVVSYEGTRCTCASDYCNGQPRITSAGICLSASLVLTLVTRMVW